MTQAPVFANPLPPLVDAQASAVTFADIGGWALDDHLAAWQVFQKHCLKPSDAQILRSGVAPPSAFLSVCEAVSKETVKIAGDAKRFFEAWFDPYEIKPSSGSGFLTGYYEPETYGSMVQTDAFRAPVLARPADVVTIPQGEIWPGIPEGFAAARRKANGENSVYPTRADIIRGDIGSLAVPIVWLKDDVEVFFMQVQGSGRVKLPDGSTVRIAYAGRNGHPYSSIGRIVVREGLLPLEDATMDKLKAWLRANPVEAKRIMEMNASYVFFRLATELSEESGPIGGAGLPLTAWRSLAVDRTIWSYGLPVWVDVALPVNGKTEAFRKLTVTEDTGSAILGPARGDLYHGSGDAAGSRAGVLRHPMRFVVLWPRSTARAVKPENPVQ